MPAAPMTLFAPIEPYQTHQLKVSSIHTIYVEECGNPQGQPVLFVHGGPGGGCEPWHRQFFDPRKYRIILFDQRGCGRSTPHAELRENTTWDLVADMQAIRKMLGIERWVLFGGSWGSTLSLTYAITYPQHCKGLILRGIFLLREAEIRWFYQEGTSWLYPDVWQPYWTHIPEAERGDLLKAYYGRLTSPDPAVRLAAAQAWSVWEGSTARLIPSADGAARFAEPQFAEAFARIECHYFMNKGFFERDGYLLARAHQLHGIPGIIVHGRYDVICPLRNAWDLQRAWPQSRLNIIADAGHAASEPGIVAALLDATEQFATLE